MRRVILAAALAALAQSAAASTAARSYSATFDDEDGFSGAFAGRDLNGDLVLSRDELTKFHADYAVYTSHPFDVWTFGGSSDLKTLSAFSVEVLADSVYGQTISFALPLSPCVNSNPFECDENVFVGSEMASFGWSMAPLVWAVAPVPLPASGVLLGLGVLGLAAWRRRMT